MHGGRYGSQSWNNKDLIEISMMKDADFSNLRKVRFLSNSLGIQQAMDESEVGDRLENRINRGTMIQKKMNDREEKEKVAHLMSCIADDSKGEVFIDDVHGCELDPRRVREARIKEMEYFRQMGVYERSTTEECKAKTGKKPIKLRWVDTNKSNSEDRPDYRSRLVAKEYKTGWRPDLYSGTPPLEAVRILLAMTAVAQYDIDAWGPVGEVSDTDEGYHAREYSNVAILYSDISRAYFNAAAQEDKYIELPEEDRTPQDGPNACGKLKVSMYGTRDAAANWEACYSEWLTKMGFIKAMSSGCIFYHEKNRHSYRCSWGRLPHCRANIGAPVVREGNGQEV